MMLKLLFKRTRPLWVVLSLFALAFTTASCQGYNTLINKDQVAAEKWSNLESQLQRRSDLIPNLVSVVKGAAKYEQDTLTKVTEARSQLTRINLTADDLSDPEKMAAFQKAQAQLSGALSRLMMVQEQYPELKANQGFHDLQVQIEGTENRILRAREEYNGAARDYNSELLRVGGQVVNRVTGKPFKPRVYFTATPESQVVPKVSF
jgi:LemA protein